MKAPSYGNLRGSILRLLATHASTDRGRTRRRTIRPSGTFLAWLAAHRARVVQYTGTDENVRQPDIRRSFNSPFWPFVLASTSVGQEGIDFHWWCSAITHWNTPANPVDFEQREGRVNRFSGHAIRRNLAYRHGSEMLRADHPWRAAYELGRDEQDRYGEFAPHWVYPGPATIERHLSPYPLSVDIARLERLKSDLALYRLTFGQPRQEDMLELLRRRGLDTDPDRLDEMRIDLSPPLGRR
ncbi:helicase-related protein [Gordonia paraffinivorans]|uniref:helicase-related protein n=1 Tax=Gordonia paraffinivorans TaxID=175628 RepID=UPI0010412A56